MSSPRQATHSDGVLEIRDRAVGPIRLPSDCTESFLRRFNEEYGGLGMAIVIPGNLVQDEKKSTVVLAASCFATVQVSPGRADSQDTESPQQVVVEQISKALAATFCGTRGDRGWLGSKESSEGLLSLLDRVSFSTATRSLGGASTVVHIEQLMESLDRGTQTLDGGKLRTSHFSVALLPVANDDEQWQQFRQQLADAYHRFASVLPLLDPGLEQTLAICFSVVNVSAYHFGVIRQKLAFLSFN